MSLDIYLQETRPTTVFSVNITHNLNTMAEAAGLYMAMWRPEELKINNAGDLIPLLIKGIDTLKSDPERFRALNPSNGWGDYDGLLRVAEEYLAACKESPSAVVSVSR